MGEYSLGVGSATPVLGPKLNKKDKRGWASQAVVVHAFNPSTWEAEADGSKFEASQVYRISFQNSQG